MAETVPQETRSCQLDATLDAASTAPTEEKIGKLEPLKNTFGIHKRRRQIPQPEVPDFPRFFNDLQRYQALSTGPIIYYTYSLGGN